MSDALWIPVRPLLKKGGRPGMWICGFATLDNVIDLDQEVLNTAGIIDSLAYLEKHGKVNWNHGAGPGDLLGDIKKACIRQDPETRQDGLYIEAKLNPKVPAAREAYNYLDGGGKLGYSVQGVYLNVVKSATPEGLPIKEVKAAFLSQVALTPEPKNHATAARILKSMAGKTISKSLTAGAGTDAATFTGGRALVPEQIGTLSVTTLQALADDFRRRCGGQSLDPFHTAIALHHYGRMRRMTPNQTAALARHIGSTAAPSATRRD
jgi:hypothetical protein